MKKSFLLLLAAPWILASCSNDDLNAPMQTGEEVEVTFEAALPSEILSRAEVSAGYGNGQTAKNLTYAVYNSAGEFLFEKPASESLTFSSSLHCPVKIRLVSGETYKIAFWAQNSAAPYTFSATDKKVTCNYNTTTPSANNAETLDAFYVLKEVTINPLNPQLNQSAEMTRATAQINIATADKSYFTGAGNQAGKWPTTSSVTLKGVPTGMNLLSGEVIMPTNMDDEITFSASTLPAATLTVNDKEYDYLSLTYVLAGTEGGVHSLITMNVDNQANGKREYKNIPVRRNWQTNIVGYLLTSETLWDVYINPVFENEYDLVQPAVWDGVTKTKVIPVTETIDGVNYNVYSIRTGEELAWAVTNLSAMSANAYVRLDNDIDLGSHQWVSAENYNPVLTLYMFKGVFDGQGHVIYNMKVTDTEGKSCGLYSYILGGTVKNVIFRDIDLLTAFVTAATSGLSKDSHGYVGAVAGEMAGGLVDNVEVFSGEINSSGDTAGGIIGLVRGECEITNCTNNANVTTTHGTGRAGGIVAATYTTLTGKNMIITNCVNNGEINGRYFVGGIAGLGYAQFDKCRNYGNVTGTNDGVAGITGNMYNYGWVKNCENYGKITSINGYGVGGIVGWIRYSTESAYQFSNVIDVSDNLNYGIVSNGGVRTGGIVGSAYDYALIHDNINRAPKIDGNNGPAAGILGDAYLNNLNSSSVISGWTQAIEVYNNVSATSLDNITGNPKDLWVNGTVARNENNR